MTGRFALPQVGDLLAEKYRVVRVVADGGMGVVFEAHHELLGKNVALKFPLPELAHLPSVAERFLAEARLCARIENEHVVRVLDVSKLDGLPYIVMELVAGVSLASEMGAPWPPAKAAAHVTQVLDGLEAVHALGVVHRDVKPENILVVATARGPLLKLIDFGIAKDSIAQQAIGRLTREGSLLGTPAYMAPEQVFDALHASSSVDLYSTGILLFEMLAGASSFTATTLHELREQVLTGRLRSLAELVPSTPRELVVIVARATALHAADRFSSASDFRQALWPFAEGWAARASSVPGSRSQPELPAQIAPHTEYTEMRTEYAEPPLLGAAVRTEYAEPPLVGAARTEYAEPPLVGAARTVPNTVPAPALASAQAAKRGRLLASVGAGVMALLGLAAVAFAVHRHQSAAEGTAPPPFATLAPETEIAPLDTESADPGAAASAAKTGAKHAEIRPATSTKLPAVEPPSTVQVDARRFRSCNTDAKASAVVVDLHVAADGTVRSANAVSSSASAPVTQCVLTRARALQFPPHEGADQVARVPVELPAPPYEPRERRRRPSWLPGRERPARDSE